MVVEFNLQDVTVEQSYVDVEGGVFHFGTLQLYQFASCFLTQHGCTLLKPYRRFLLQKSIEILILQNVLIILNLHLYVLPLWVGID